ncbi:MAG: hypothetical protein LBH74_01150, partial [Nitrososphaerota archaeon]|nr:hypothetical protein [Nitrososphaerota archaeon]
MIKIKNLRKTTSILLVLALVIGCFVIVFTPTANAAQTIPTVIPQEIWSQVKPILDSYDSYQSFTATGYSISGNEGGVGLWRCVNEKTGTADVYLLVLNIPSGFIAGTSKLGNTNGDKSIPLGTVQLPEGAATYSLIKFPKMPELTGNEALSVAMGNGNGHKIEGKVNEFFIFATYAIEYYYDNETTPRKITSISDPVKVGTVITSYPDEVMTGYKFGHTVNFPLTINAVTANNVIKVYYVIDETQVYTIEYFATTGGSVTPTSEEHQVLYTGANDGSTA